MSENLEVRLSMDLVGCKKTVDSGYTKEEWKAMDVEEQNEIVNEIIWSYIGVSWDED